jgi:hypothetical protein
VLNLSRVTFLDSTALHILVSTAKALRGKGTLVLEHPSAFVVRLLELTGLNRPVDGFPLEISWDSVRPTQQGPGAAHRHALVVNRSVEAQLATRSTARVIALISASEQREELASDGVQRSGPQPVPVLIQ